ncbi:hydrophobin [Crassisporium funariophilum]|nr:hydrophobin [Crassisporium funariophilum]
MFFRAALLAFVPVTLNIFAAATYTVTVTSFAPYPTPLPASQCNTGDLFCCFDVYTSSAGVMQPLLGLLGIIVEPASALIGANCNPINVIGIGQGGQCAYQPVCCQNNQFSGIVHVGCTPVSFS